MCVCVRESVRDVKYVWTNICTRCMHWNFCQLSLCVRTCLVLHSLNFALVSLVDAHQTVCNCLKNFLLSSSLSLPFLLHTCAHFSRFYFCSFSLSVYLFKRGYIVEQFGIIFQAYTCASPSNQINANYSEWSQGLENIKRNSGIEVFSSTDAKLRLLSLFYAHVFYALIWMNCTRLFGM